MKIGIIDYGMGNLKSVSNALDYIGADHLISSKVEELEVCDKLILPGVGAFKDAVARIRKMGIDAMLHRFHQQGKPLLGICLGMQLLFDSSTEFGEHEGLGLLPGRIVKMEVPLKVPHMGWNSLIIKKEEPMFHGLTPESYVYFVHSYHLETEADVVSATTFYGKEIQIAAQSGNTYALQFHPEKSGDTGLQILKNFIDRT
ncbi:imidazole glycerol phosphate synthase subunit HisH [Anaerotalea alkaliphila]|uniref:Imidazole glycerol phosphate synthase subunit HisH n=1 Tax=Anaerotalea alkaliphila TaxID=2662126 RepID=A0A7X5HXW6_9FIRM|nr:imidazole glycerol phosphate synthase subunit HisH [Anaerotalea alkaliphila]NDL68679.1 imidazole glycerol phosphate synthase subunit HisH [Anaerotalea alkaliphila]